jgi:hypothetical protein
MALNGSYATFKTKILSVKEKEVDPWLSTTQLPLQEKKAHPGLPVFYFTF